MSNKNRGFVIFSAGLVMVLTVVIHFMVAPSFFRFAISGSSLLFLIIYETCLFGSMLFIKPMPLKFTIVIIFGLQLVIGIVIAVLFVGFMPLNVTSYWVWNLLLLGASILIGIAFLYFSGQKSEEDRRVVSAQNKIALCKAACHDLTCMEEFSKYHNILEGLMENLKYSDNSTETGMEDMLFTELKKLEAMKNEDDDGKVEAQLDQISRLLNQRNFNVKLGKRGGF